MMICNNKDGMPDCCGECFDTGVCQSKGKCPDSLVVTELLVKTLMVESGRYDKMMNKFREMAEAFRELEEAKI